MNEPRVIESVTNECQLLGRAHESSSARAEQLIACLEGEIAKRDEVIAGLTNSRDFWREKAITTDDKLAAIEAQEPVAFTDGAGAMYSASLMASLNISSGGLAPLYSAPVVNRKLTTECKRCSGTARVDIGTVCDNWVDCPECAAPVSEAKAEGVVMPELIADIQARCLAGMDGAAVFAYGALSAIHTMLDEVARLAAAPAAPGAKP